MRRVWPILVFRDKVFRAIESAIEKIPGLVDSRMVCMLTWKLNIESNHSSLSNTPPAPFPPEYNIPVPAGEVPDQGGPQGGDASSIYETNWDIWQQWMEPVFSKVQASWCFISLGSMKLVEFCTSSRLAFQKGLTFFPSRSSLRQSVALAGSEILVLSLFSQG